MKRSTLIWSTIWIAFITLAHVWINIGFDRIAHSVQVSLGNEREELIVGFLPVT